MNSNKSIIKIRFKEHVQKMSLRHKINKKDGVIITSYHRAPTIHGEGGTRTIYHWYISTLEH